MDSRKIATEYRMAQWAQIIQDRKASGESIQAYCRNRGISRDAYFSWQRKLREAACTQLVAMQTGKSQTDLIPIGFTEVRLPASQSLSLQPEAAHGTISIEVSSIRMVADANYPPEQLAHLLRELVKPC